MTSKEIFIRVHSDSRFKDFLRETGNRFYLERKRQNLKRKDLAINNWTMVRLENGKGITGLRIFYVLADLLDCDLSITLIKRKKKHE